MLFLLADLRRTGALANGVSPDVLAPAFRAGWPNHSTSQLWAAGAFR
jgi:hypothetical protein